MPDFIIDQLTGEMVHEPQKLEYVGDFGPYAEAAYLGERIICTARREPKQEPK